MAKQLKILIATGLFPPEVGGPATYSKALMEELPRREFAVDILPFREVRSWPKVLRHFLYFLKCLNRGRSADIIYAQDPVSVGLPAWCAVWFLRTIFRQKNKKFLLKIVGDYAWEQQQQESGIKNYELRFITPEEFQTRKFGLTTELRRKVERFVAKRADKVVVPSEYLKKIVTMWGVANDKITVVYNSFELLDIARPTKERMGGKIIFSAGRLVPWKGFDMLIEIMPDILEKVPEAKLLIAGDGPEREALELRIKNYELGGRVKLLGNLPRKEVLEYLAAADVFVLNTGYEGLSHMLLEVLAVGVPIVTTNVCGNPEIIEDGKNGLLVGYNDRLALTRAITRLLTDKKLRGDLIQNGMGEYSLGRFKKENMIKGVEEIVKSLIK